MEAMLGIAVFALLLSGLLSGLVYGQQSTADSGERARAVFLAEEALAAVANIRDGAWNDLSLDQSGLTAGTEWTFTGDGTSDSIDGYTRTLTFSPVCRDSADVVTACPGSYTDVHTIQAPVSVSWTGRFLSTKSIEVSTYFTNWEGTNWTQTDWSGGSGQTIWSDDTRYESDSGGLAITPAGQVTLANTGCGLRSWGFDSSADYTYSSSVEVTGGVAQLVSGGTAPDSNTMGLWHHNESSGTLADSSGRGNTLTVSGNPTYSVAGQFGTAVRFDSTDDYGAITDAAQSGLDITGSITVEAWVNKTALSGSDYIVSKWGSTTATQSYILFIGNLGTPTFQIRNGASTASATSPSGTVTTGTWYHIAGVYDGSEVRVYVNGVETGSTAYTSGIANTSTAFSVSASGGSSFNGTIDEVRVSDTARYTTDFTVPSEPFGVTYTSSEPTIQPVTSYDPTTVDQWYALSETATKNGSTEIYYQLSDDDGATWQYWNGSAWATATASTNYNTASTVNTNITSFSTSNGKLLWRAFLVSNGSDQVQLDTVDLTCRMHDQWTFDTASDYTYDTAKIELSGGLAQLVSTGTVVNGIANSVLDSFEYDPSNGQFSSIAHVSGDVFAVAFTGPSGDGFVDTVTIDSVGAIGNSVVDTLEFDTADGQTPSLLNVSGSVYVVAYSGSGNDGFVKTFTIDSSGNISNSVTDTLEFDTTNCQQPSVVGVGDDLFLIAYNGPSGDGFAVLVNVATDGQIAAAVTDSLEFDTVDGWAPHVIQASGHVYAIAYTSTGSDGFLATVEMTTSGTYATDSPTLQPTSSLTPSAIESWAAFAETATIAGTAALYYQLSDDDGVTWQYWNGSAWATATASTDYNTASTVNTNINAFSVTAGRILWRAFFVTGGTDQIQLDTIDVAFHEPLVGEYASAAELVSSAFSIGSTAAIQTIEWDETIPSCTPACDLQFQIRAAPDSSGSPGTWTDWYGTTGSGSYFTAERGELISSALNGNAWMQYRVEFTASASAAPTLEEVRINYKP